MTIKANPERALRDLYHLRSIGTYKTGVHRPTLSEDDLVTRRWLVDQLKDIGHEAWIDGIGNVISRTPATGNKLLAGSHLETQSHAGWLDGALGVVYALEAARAVVEAGRKDVGVEVFAFADEEGHFGSFTGSRSLTGELTESDIDQRADRTTGRPLRQAIADAGLSGVPRHRVEPARYVGMLEAHIEQGDWLESQDLHIGVVTSIVAIWQYKIVFEGVQNHAGTTRMAIRKDAGVALRRFCQRVEERFPEVCGERSVWTVGQISMEPGAPSIIPGRAEMILQFRDDDMETLLRLEATVRELVAEANAAGPCKASWETTNQNKPALMDQSIQSALDAGGAVYAPGKHARMPSGAGHDAQMMAQLMPAGMMFIPSIGGISHHWTEDSTDADIMRGAQVYADAAARILGA